MNEKLPPREMYGERKLMEMVEFATERLTPGPAYELYLEGVNIPTLVHKELEAYFDASLDNGYGAQVSLFFDGITNEFRLRKLGLKLRDLDGSAELLRAKTLGFIPNFSINEQGFTKSDATFMSHQEGDSLLGRLGIDAQPPINDVVGYKAWRSNLLFSTQGWRLIEKVEIPTGLSQFDAIVPTTMGESEARTLYTASAIALSNIETLPSLDSELIKTKRVRRSITLFDDERGQAKQFDGVVEVVNEMGVRHIRLYNQAFLKQVDPFVINDVKTTDLGIEPITLDRNSFESFRELIEEATELKTTA